LLVLLIKRWKSLKKDIYETFVISVVYSVVIGCIAKTINLKALYAYGLTAKTCS